jgi:hypothetical protein
MSSSSKRKELGNPTPVLMILLLVVPLPLNSVSLSSFKQESFWISIYPKSAQLVFHYSTLIGSSPKTIDVPDTNVTGVFTKDYNESLVTKLEVLSSRSGSASALYYLFCEDGESPTPSPTFSSPTGLPTISRTVSPTGDLSASLTASPTGNSFASPTSSPTELLTVSSTVSQTGMPTSLPTISPTASRT